MSKLKMPNDKCRDIKILRVPLFQNDRGEAIEERIMKSDEGRSHRKTIVSEQYHCNMIYWKSLLTNTYETDWQCADKVNRRRIDNADYTVKRKVV